jgi:aminoglycoside 3'-phosphotransferase I
MVVPIALPDSVRSAITGYASTPVTDGQSGGVVFRLTAPGRTMLYLKCGTGRVARDITAEMARLEWLAGRLPVPAVRLFVRNPGEAYLLTTAVPGQSASDYLATHPELQAETVASLAHFLRAVHALPLAECPFHAGHAQRLAMAWQNLEAGLVDTDDFDEEREGWTAEQVWSAMEGLLPLTFDRVVTHGDFSLDNVFVENGCVTGCIDVGRVGAADPYQDLAILWHNLAAFGEAAQRALWPAYGIRAPDIRKLQFHLCLDEFF